MPEYTREEIELERMKRKNTQSLRTQTEKWRDATAPEWTKYAKEMGATGFRTVAGAAVSPLDIPLIPWHLLQGARGKEAFSFSDTAKKGMDALTEGVGKPTTKRGRVAETAADFFTPFGLVKVAQKLGIKGAQHLGNIAKSSMKTKKGRVLDTLLGKTAIKNHLAKPTVGNVAGIGATHLTGEDSPLIGIASAVGANVATDLVGAAFSKGGRKLKSLNRTRKLNDPHMREEVEKRLATENLGELKQTQKTKMNKEFEREQSIIHKNKQDEMQYRKAVEAEKKSEIQAKVDAIKERLAFEQVSKDRLALSPDFAQALSKSTDVNAGKSAIKQSKSTNKAMKKKYADLYKIKEELEKKMGTGEVVNLNEVIKYYHDAFDKTTSVRSMQNFFKGEEGDLIKAIFDLPHDASMRRNINGFFNPKTKISLNHAEEIKDLTTKNSDLNAANTSGKRGSIKHVGALARKAIDAAAKKTDPEMYAASKKVDKQYAADSPLREAANIDAKLKYSPAEVAQGVEHDLTKDAHRFKVAGTPQLVSNVLRKAARTKTGDLDSRQLAEKLIAYEPEVRKLILNTLPDVHKREINGLIRNYKKDVAVRAAREAEKDARLPVYKEPIIKPEKTIYENKQPKSFAGEKISDIESYLGSLEPEHHAQVSANKGVQESIKQTKQIEKSTRDKIPVRWMNKAARVIPEVGQALFGKSFEQSVPKVVEEVRSLAARPAQTKNLMQRAGERMKEVASEVPVAKLASMEKNSHKEPESGKYSYTPEEIELERMRRRMAPLKWDEKGTPYR